MSSGTDIMKVTERDYRNALRTYVSLSVRMSVIVRVQAIT